MNIIFYFPKNKSSHFSGVGLQPFICYLLTPPLFHAFNSSLSPPLMMDFLSPFIFSTEPHSSPYKLVVFSSTMVLHLTKVCNITDENPPAVCCCRWPKASLHVLQIVGDLSLSLHPARSPPGYNLSCLAQMDRWSQIVDLKSSNFPSYLRFARSIDFKFCSHIFL
jgi:hypothetical protein